MLVLTRKKNESIIIGDDIEVTVSDIGQGQVRLGILAPKNIKVYRKEILQEIRDADAAAADMSANLRTHNDRLRELFGSGAPKKNS